MSRRSQQRAPARGHRWLALLEAGEIKFATGACQDGGGGQQLREPAAILNESLPPEPTLFALAVDPLVVGGAAEQKMTV